MRRWNKLPEKRLQLRMIAVFLSLTAVALMLQLFLVSRALVGLAESLPNDGDLVLDQMPILLAQSILWAVLLLPLNRAAAHRLPCARRPHRPLQTPRLPARPSPVLLNGTVHHWCPTPTTSPSDLSSAAPVITF